MWSSIYDLSQKVVLIEKWSDNLDIDETTLLMESLDLDLGTLLPADVKVFILTIGGDSRFVTLFLAISPTSSKR